MTTEILALITVLFAYLVGAVPTGYLLVKKAKGLDIREHGSGNTGATNVKRLMGNKAFVFVLLMDFLKGFLAVKLTMWVLSSKTFGYLPQYLPTWATDELIHQTVYVLVALAAIIGHSRSVFLNFSGGKSAITGLATVVALMPTAGLILGLLAFLIIKITRTVSIGSMSVAVITPMTLIALQYPFPYIIYGTTAALYVIYLHRTNIMRLIQGTENRLT